MRHASRWSLDEPARRAYAALLLSLRGSVCLYQGEELGLTEAYVPFEDLQDPYGIQFWPKFKGRDGCRTPIPWVTDNQNGGFSDAKPWLPMAMEHLDRSVMRQSGDGASTLAFYRKMLAYRKSREVFAKGSIEIVEAREDFLSFRRVFEGEAIFCAFNLSGDGGEVTVPDGVVAPDKGAPFKADIKNNTVMLEAWEAFFGLGTVE